MIAKTDNIKVLVLDSGPGKEVFELAQKAVINSTEPTVVGFDPIQKKEGNPPDLQILMRPEDLREVSKDNRAERRKREAAVRRQGKRQMNRRVKTLAVKVDQDLEDYEERSYLGDDEQYPFTCCKCGKDFQGNTTRDMCRICKHRPEKVSY